MTVFKNRYTEARTALNSVIIEPILSKKNRQSCRRYASLIDWTAVLNRCNQLDLLLAPLLASKSHRSNPLKDYLINYLPSSRLRMEEWKEIRIKLSNLPIVEFYHNKRPSVPVAMMGMTHWMTASVAPTARHTIIVLVLKKS